MFVRHFNRLCVDPWFLVSMVFGLVGMTQFAVGQQLNELLGTWSGNGRIVLQADKAERIKCNAYNRREGSELRLVVRCASPSYKIEIRSRLQRKGSELFGQWEERTYNAEGTATGRITSSTLSLRISGGGFDGQMNVSYTSKRQKIRITTQGIDMKSVDMNLSRAR